MKARFLGIVAAIALFAGSSVLQTSPAAAQQVSVNYDYVYFASGSHQRQPPATASSWLVPIKSQSGGQESNGDLFSPPQPPCPLIIQTERYVGSGPTGHLVPVTLTYDFAFLTVVGGSPYNGGA